LDETHPFRTGFRLETLPPRRRTARARAAY